MKTYNENHARGLLAIAVQSALAAVIVMPLTSSAQTTSDDEVAALKQPANFVEIGALNVSKDSAKFGEYTGLNKSGPYAVGNLNIRGGDAYAGGDGTLRWGLFGTDLGTTSRDLGGNVANQGQWNFGLRFDEIRHDITDSYQTPFQGSMGGNIFTLPTSFGVVNSTAISGKTNPLVGTRNLKADQLASFHTEDVGTTRKNTAANAGYIFNDHWNLQFDFNRLDQSGAKLISGASSGVSTGAGLQAHGKKRRWPP